MAFRVSLTVEVRMYKTPYNHHADVCDSSLLGSRHTDSFVTLQSYKVRIVWSIQLSFLPRLIVAYCTARFVDYSSRRHGLRRLISVHLDSKHVCPELICDQLCMAQKQRRDAAYLRKGHLLIHTLYA